MYSHGGLWNLRFKLKMLLSDRRCLPLDSTTIFIARFSSGCPGGNFNNSSCWLDTMKNSNQIWWCDRLCYYFLVVCSPCIFLGYFQVFQLINNVVKLHLFCLHISNSWFLINKIFRILITDMAAKVFLGAEDVVTKVTMHCGEERIFCPIKCCCENWLWIRDPVSAKMSVSECVQ